MLPPKHLSTHLVVWPLLSGLTSETFLIRYVIQESYLDSDNRDGCLVKIFRIKNRPELNWTPKECLLLCSESASTNDIPVQLINFLNWCHEPNHSIFFFKKKTKPLHLCVLSVPSIQRDNFVNGSAQRPLEGASVETIFVVWHTSVKKYARC
jgi:hypothetical protein